MKSLVFSRGYVLYIICKLVIFMFGLEWDLIRISNCGIFNNYRLRDVIF